MQVDDGFHQEVQRRTGHLASHSDVDALERLFRERPQEGRCKGCVGKDDDGVAPLFRTHGGEDVLDVGDLSDVGGDGDDVHGLPSCQVLLEGERLGEGLHVLFHGPARQVGVGKDPRVGAVPHELREVDVPESSEKGLLAGVEGAEADEDDLVFPGHLPYLSFQGEGVGGDLTEQTAFRGQPLRDGCGLEGLIEGSEYVPDAFHVCLHTAFGGVLVLEAAEIGGERFLLCFRQALAVVLEVLVRIDGQVDAAAVGHGAVHIVEVLQDDIAPEDELIKGFSRGIEFLVAVI